MSSESRPAVLSSLTLPQPVALACGRLSRARTAQEKVDGAIKAAEVLTRYVAAVSLSSVSARPEGQDVPPLADFQGNLAFGTFLSAIQWAVRVSCAHPLKGVCDKLQARKDWDTPLVQLLTLRNELGHDLDSLSDARARAILDTHKPDALLGEAVATLTPILELPLFVFEEQQLAKRRLVARRLLLMGESAEPRPEEIEVEGQLEHMRTPYVAVDDGCLCLAPLLTWDVAQRVSSYALYFIDKIDNGTLSFKTFVPDKVTHTRAEFEDLSPSLAGERTRSLERCIPKGKQSFSGEWRKRRREIEASVTPSEVHVPWADFDADTLAWYATRLAGGPTTAVDAQAIVGERLLDSREMVEPREARDLQLLFGTRAVVRQVLGRTLLDCRVTKTKENRWDERLEHEENVLGCLRAAIDFFARHVGFGVPGDLLRATSGTPDYIAMREALVNLFIHQDYSDKRAPAQVDMSPVRVVFFNAGKSLLGERALAEGGRSQARNPLLARALRLIGFAELAGSGLRALNRAWAAAGRVPPRWESSASANTFTLELDWRAVPQDWDVFWNSRIGAKVTPIEARLLDLCATSDGMTTPRLAAAIADSVASTETILGRLLRNGLLIQGKDSWAVAEHLVELARERAKVV